MLLQGNENINQSLLDTTSDLRGCEVVVVVEKTQNAAPECDCDEKDNNNNKNR